MDERLERVAEAYHEEVHGSGCDGTYHHPHDNPCMVTAREVAHDLIEAYLGDDDDVYVKVAKSESGLPPDGVVHDGEGNWLVPLSLEES